MARWTNGDGALETHGCVYTQTNITHPPMQDAEIIFLTTSHARIPLPPTTVEPGIIHDISYFRAYVHVF